MTPRTVETISAEIAKRFSNPYLANPRAKTLLQAMGATLHPDLTIGQVLGPARCMGPIITFQTEKGPMLFGPSEQNSQIAADAVHRSNAWLHEVITSKEIKDTDQTLLPDHFRQILQDNGISPQAFEIVSDIIGSVSIALDDGRHLQAKQKYARGMPIGEWDAIKMDISADPKLSLTTTGLSGGLVLPSAVRKTMPGRPLQAFFDIPYRRDAIINKVVQRQASIIVTLKNHDN